ncbi:MucR family transcriptional regulator [Thermodesulfobacteriota bacterium]
MSKTLTEMTTEIVAAQASHSSISGEELVELLEKTFVALKDIRDVEEGLVEKPAGLAEAGGIDPRKSILKNKVICLECGREFKQLSKKHLEQHGMSSGEYRTKYGFSARQPLTAKSLSAKRRKIAKEHNLGQVLSKARKAKAQAKSKARPDIEVAKKKVILRKKKVESG